MKPTKENRKKFDLDLEYGQIFEDKIADMFTKSKVEVKSERGMWMSTGNIAIEYESYGKPSGIMATESDYWLHNLCDGDFLCLSILIKVDNLKKLIKENAFPSVCGGDHNASRMYLIKLDKLVSPQILKGLNCVKKTR